MAAWFGITSVPTLVAVRENRLLSVQPGARPSASLEDLIGKVNALDVDDVRRRIAEQERAAS